MNRRAETVLVNGNWKFITPVFENEKVEKVFKGRANIVLIERASIPVSDKSTGEN